MIRSYGLHWHVDRVFWGHQNSETGLLGTASKKKRAVVVDFREQRGIYALYADYEIVYIGQTGAGNKRLFSRLRDHRSDHLAERWNRFSWFGTQRVLTGGHLSVDTEKVSDTIVGVLNILEAVVTAVAEPRLNLQRGKWGEALQYFQKMVPGSFLHNQNVRNGEVVDEGEEDGDD